VQGSGRPGDLTHTYQSLHINRSVLGEWWPDESGRGHQEKANEDFKDQINQHLP